MLRRILAWFKRKPKTPAWVVFGDKVLYDPKRVTADEARRIWESLDHDHVRLEDE